MIWLAYSTVWLSCASVVGYGLYLTNNINCLFFMLIPLFVNLKSSDKDKNKNKEILDENRQD